MPGGNGSGGASGAAFPVGGGVGASGGSASGGAGASSGGAGASGGGASGGSASGGGASGSPGNAGSAGQQSGVPAGWIKVDDIDYSIVPGPNFETVRLMFEAAECSGSSCHFGGRNHLQVNKSPDALYTYMKSFTTLACGKLIDTTNPAESALVKYLRGPCGNIERMPQFKCSDGTEEWCVPEYYIQFIQDWIAKGAPR